ncbi:MAG: LrgB family protein, partial [Oscillibacter sp.]|nr:LrgB family protein [Oscillibacter sp.]
MMYFLTSSATWGVALTLGAFALGRLVQKLSGQKWLNPLIPASVIIIVVLSVLNIPYADYKS